MKLERLTHKRERYRMEVWSIQSLMNLQLELVGYANSSRLYVMGTLALHCQSARLAGAMLCLVWLLVLCCAAGGHGMGGRTDTSLKDAEGQVVEDETDIIMKDAGGQVVEDRTDTSLKNSSLGIQAYSGILPSVFDGLPLRDHKCVGANAQEGTCYSRNECNRLRGTISGNCAQNWGSCCIIKRSCDSSTNHNNTYFTNLGYPGFHSGSDCSITVYRSQPNICQLRVDFLEFTVAQPDNNGNCDDDDYFHIIGRSTEEVPKICGENSGQHVYVDFQRGNTPIRVNVKVSDSPFNRKWNIKLTQIECTSPERAPSRALMCFRELKGNVKSFNYGQSLVSPGSTRQLANMNYGVFIKMASGYCSIEWQGDPNDFNVSDDVIGGGGGVVQNQGDECRAHYVIIPNSGPGDRFCGTSFSSSPVKTFTNVLTVVTDPNGNNEKRGFSLSYRQIPC